MSKNSRRFTLLELLIVIMIILLLTALLLPAVVKTKGKAAKVHCVNNLKQLSTAFLMYASDNSERLPPYRTSASAADHPGTNWAAWTFPYHQTANLLVCPASPKEPPLPTAEGFHLYDGHYGWNYDGTQGNRGPLHAHIDQPSKGYLVFDSGDQCVIYGKNNWNNLLEELDLDWESRGEGCNRHLSLVNVAAVDGHVFDCNLKDFLAAPCKSFRQPWYMEWENGSLEAGTVPFPDR